MERQEEEEEGKVPECCYFKRGDCRFGSGCRFQHQYSSTLCQFAPNCRYKHKTGGPDRPVPQPTAPTPIDLTNVKQQPFEFYLILDLEGKIEILEFPVQLVCARTLQTKAVYHRYVRPQKMEKEFLRSYIRNKYGKMGLEEAWWQAAIPFPEVLQQFEKWLAEQGISPSENKWCWVTCGDWDVKTQIPKQCITSEIPLPTYFNAWCNLKDVYYNHYGEKAMGMKAMLSGLNIRLEGVHHSGKDDANNIAAILKKMISEGAVLPHTARRDGTNGKIVWTFANRVSDRRAPKRLHKNASEPPAAAQSTVPQFLNMSDSGESEED